MITALRKHWIVGLMGIVFVLALAVTLNIAREIGQPFGGFYANRSHSRNLWLVDAPTPPWWPALTEAGLRYEDVLVGLEDHTFDSAANLILSFALIQCAFIMISSLFYIGLYG
jgi:hypothetical protein